MEISTNMHNWSGETYTTDICTETANFGMYDYSWFLENFKIVHIDTKGVSILAFHLSSSDFSSEFLSIEVKAQDIGATRAQVEAAFPEVLEINLQDIPREILARAAKSAIIWIANHV